MYGPAALVVAVAALVVSLGGVPVGAAPGVGASRSRPAPRP